MNYPSENPYQSPAYSRPAILAAENERATFIQAGGKEFNAIPCLNENPVWIAALANLVFRELEGWLAESPGAATREATKLRAKALGASA